MSQREVINILKKYLEVLRQNKIEVYKAFLYGSYSKNIARKDSDIDVFLVLDTSDSDDATLAKPWLYTKYADLRIEPYVVHKNIFLNQDKSPLMYIIEKEGIEIK